VLVCQTVPAATGTELALGIVSEPELGPLVVVGAGGVLVDLLADRAVALPAVSAKLAAGMVAGLRVSKLLAGVSGARPADLDAVTRAIAGCPGWPSSSASTSRRSTSTRLSADRTAPSPNDPVRAMCRSAQRGEEHYRAGRVSARFAEQAGVVGSSRR
jgi:hypothetical protein